MAGWKKHFVRFFALPYFLIYALSPIYVSTMDDKGCVAELPSGENSVIFGILMVSVVADAIIPDGDPGSAYGSAEMQSSQDEDIILIKKKRAILRKGYDCKPALIASCVKYAEDEQLHILPRSDFDVPRDLIHNHTNGYRLLSPGLSPPSLLS